MPLQLLYTEQEQMLVLSLSYKKGKAGKTKINLTQNLGYAEISNRLGMRDWTAASVEAAFGAGEVAKYNAAVGSFGLIDYEDEIYGNRGIISDTKLSVSGGNDKTQFYVGTSYRDEEGIIKLTGFDRFSLRANIDHKISNTFEISSSSNFIQGQSRRSFTGNEKKVVSTDTH